MLESIHLLSTEKVKTFIKQQLIDEFIDYWSRSFSIIIRCRSITWIFRFLQYLFTA